jgi:hypothetical protein
LAPLAVSRGLLGIPAEAAAHKTPLILPIPVEGMDATKLGDLAPADCFCHRLFQPMI